MKSIANVKINRHIKLNSVVNTDREVGEYILITVNRDKLFKYICIKNISLIIISITIIMLIGTKYISQSFLDEMKNKIKIELKQKVDIAYNTITPIREARRKGDISIEDAREQIASIVRNMTYKDIYSDNYIFMSTYDGYFLVQPFETEKEKTNMLDYQDVKGNYIIRELINAAKQSPDGGYVKYFYKLPNTETVEEKLAYVKGIPEIKAYIGTGVYVNSKYRDLYAILNMQKITLLLFTLIIFTLITLNQLKLKKINNQLKDELKARLGAEEELKIEKNLEINQRRRLETLFNNSQDAIVEFDLDGKVLNVNESFEKIFGYSKKECLGKDIDKLIVIDEKYWEAKELTNKTLNKGIINVEAIRYKKDKTQVNVLIRSVFIKIKGQVVGGYGIYTDITEVKNYEKQLEYMSIYDSLTEVYNLNYFENKIAEYKNDKNNSIAFIMCDLNGLKFINDTLGHQYGDILLKNFAGILKKSVREKDVVARVGGDEFVIILHQTNKEKVENIMKRIKENIEKHNNLVENKMLKISVAMGYSIAENKDINKALKEADDSMYINKLIVKESSKSQILNVLMVMLSEKDYITSGHTKRVANMCEKVAERIGLEEDMKNRLILLAEVHDLGKIAIPDSILQKQGKLTDEEWEIMKSHTEKGYRIAMNSNELSSVAELILKHHERWDGKGYPLGLKGYDISIECRILSVVDAYDAMTNLRSYNKIKTHEEAIEEIKRYSGTQFDPEIVDVFISIFDKTLSR